MTTTHPLNINDIRLSVKNTKTFTYTGSKFKYGKHFHNLLENIEQKHFEYYIEAFSGTLGSLFHNLEKVSADKYIINDGNSRIINLYEQVKNNVEEVKEKYLALESEFDRITPKSIRKKYKSYEVAEIDRPKIENLRTYYEAVKKYFNSYDKLDANSASMFLFLMKHCVNGIYQENVLGEFTTTFNWNSKEIKVAVMIEALDNQSLFFTNNEVIFESMDIFELTTKYNSHDTFIYLDPPYCTNSSKRFYSREGLIDFRQIEPHMELLDICSKFHTVMYSNTYSEEFIPMFDYVDDFERNNNAGGQKTTASKDEILAIKINEEQLEHRPIEEILGITHKPIEQILNIASTGALNNEEYTNKNEREIA